MREELGVSLGWYLLYDGPPPGGGALSRSFRDAPRWSTELSTQAWGQGAELAFHVWEKPDETKAGVRLKGALSEQYCDWAAPAALGKPISERSRSRWPKRKEERDRHDSGSRVAGGSEM